MRALPHGSRARLATVAGGVALVLVLLTAAGYLVGRVTGRIQPPVQAVPTQQPPVPRTWASGIWTGGTWGTARVASFAEWRGSSVQTVVTYPAYDTWSQLTNDSDWHVAVFDGFPGTLVYGLPLLPKAAGSGTLSDVAAGKHDDAFHAVAATLRAHHREKSYVRIGLEANGDWFPWGANAGTNTPKDFVAAFRHVSALLRRDLPGVRIVFDLSCGAPLRDQSSRTDALTKLYPGDDAVDIVGCDTYDHYSLIAHNQKRFATAIRPVDAVGLQDVLDFAVAHGKRMAVPEWGLTAKAARGGGDNPYFIYAMYSWFAANAAHLEFENYFNDGENALHSAIWGVNDNPASAQEYQRLYSATPQPKLSR